MRSSKISSASGYILLVALILLQCLGQMAILDARSFDAVVNTRELPRVETRVQPGRAAWQQNHADPLLGPGINLKLVASAAYDSNIFLSADRPESDLVVAISPQFSIGNGGKPGGDGAYVRAAYLPAVIIYQDSSASNRIDHDVRFSSAWRGKALELAYDGVLRRLGDATADAGAPANRYEYDSAMRVAFFVREKLSISASLGTTGTRYDRDVFFNVQQRYGEIALDYEYSPKTRLAWIYRYGREEVDRAGNQNVHRILARMAWQPREKILCNFGVGVEHRDYDLGSRTKPVFDARIAWQPRQETEFYLAGFLREEASGYFDGQNYRLANATIGVSQTLAKGWSASLEAGVETASYLRVSGSGQADRSDRILFLGSTLNYSINDDLRIGIFYRHSRNNSNRGDFDYSGHQSGINLEYQF